MSKFHLIQMIAFRLLLISWLDSIPIQEVAMHFDFRFDSTSIWIIQLQRKFDLAVKEFFFTKLSEKNN